MLKRFFSAMVIELGIPPALAVGSVNLINQFGQTAKLTRSLPFLHVCLTEEKNFERDI